MKIEFVGDSITVGTYTSQGSDYPDAIVKKGYPHYVARFLKCDEMKNYAINGISYSSTSTVNSDYAIARLVENIKEADIVFLAGGTNDYGTDVKIGNVKDLEDVSFCGAVNIVFQMLKKNNPTAKFYVLAPIPRLNEDKPNKSGHVLNDYRRILKIKAEESGFFFIDGSRLAIYPERTEDKNAYILDGTHLNENGHEKLAEFIIKNIENQ